MARTDPQLNFRIPAELKERLEAAAVENKRTLTAELVARLEQSLSQGDEKTPALEDLSAALDAKLGVLRSGLGIAKVATKFLEVEVPQVRKSDSFAMLQESIDASIKVATDEAPPTSLDALDRAAEALSTLRASAEKIGLFRMVESLHSNTQPTKHDLPRSSRRRK